MTGRISIAVMLAALVLGGGCRSRVTRGDIESVTRLALPPGAHDFQAFVDGWEDTISRYRFRVPPAEVTAFLGGIRFDGPVSTTRNDMEATRDEGAPEWWRPWESRQFLSGTMAFENSRGERGRQLVVVDTSDPRSSTVFLYRYDP